jgi:hypothetical protein
MAAAKRKMDCFAALAMTISKPVVVLGEPKRSTLSAVIARHRVGVRRLMTGSGGRSSIPETPMIQSRSCSVLDTPPARYDELLWRGAQRHP